MASNLVVFCASCLCHCEACVCATLVSAISIASSSTHPTHPHALTPSHPHTLTPSQDAMDLPDDKRQVVMGSPEDKKWQMIRDNTRRRRQVPPHHYISKLRPMMDSDGGHRRTRRRVVDNGILQSLQGLEISLRTNNIRSVPSSGSGWLAWPMQSVLLLGHGCLRYHACLPLLMALLVLHTVPAYKHKQHSRS